MTTTNEVKLPEQFPDLPEPSTTARLWTIFDMLEYAKQYGTLCYEAGLAAGRVQAGQQIEELERRNKNLREAHQRSLSEEENLSDKVTALQTQLNRVTQVLQVRNSELAALKQSLAQPAQEPDHYCISKPLMEDIYSTLVFYSNESSYKAPRIGGVLEGCPRGEDPTSAQLIENAVYALRAIRREIGEHGEQLTVSQQPAQAAVPEGWQPIETAPQTRSILLWWRTMKYPVVGEWYDGEQGEGWRCEGDRCLPTNQHDCTHWMELPIGPLNAAQDSGEGS